ncbi:VOC family protein [Roseibium sp. RKSG952]|uniref:VOC family protein n=1 Tax=Roseibium sp. RKSG952 TaxID=2529384 RepID=UPI001AD8F106|nr:VOC family protein [Roseibium sp. RKSG952]
MLARDDNYPRTTVSDGTCRLTLWQADRSKPAIPFDRKTQIGLHHLALEVGTEAELNASAARIREWPGVTIEFEPEPLAGGPRKHMMFAEPGGIRLELIWTGTA